MCHMEASVDESNFPDGQCVGLKYPIFMVLADIIAEVQRQAIIEGIKRII